MALKLEWSNSKSADKTPVSGIFDIEDVSLLKGDPIVDNRLRPKWTILAFEAHNFGSARSANNETAWYKYKIDTPAKSIQITFTDDPNVSHTLNYTIPSQDRIVLKGDYFGMPATIILKRKTFELTERSFHWVSEQPYNK
ncbi:hypothetical protein D3C86_1685300 [compost metagenome]